MNMTIYNKNSSYKPMFSQRRKRTVLPSVDRKPSFTIFAVIRAAHLENHTA